MVLTCNAQSSVSLTRYVAILAIKWKKEKPLILGEVIIEQGPYFSKNGHETARFECNQLGDLEEFI